MSVKVMRKLNLKIAMIPQIMVDIPVNLEQWFRRFQ